MRRPWFACVHANQAFLTILTFFFEKEIYYEKKRKSGLPPASLAGGGAGEARKSGSKR
jgi:hypothetical protein